MIFRAHAIGLRRSLRSIRAGRLLVILFAALAVGLLSDGFRRERVFFSPPLPRFTTVPAQR